MIMYLVWVKPFTLPGLNFIESFNEICLLLEGYGLIFISEMMDDNYFKWEMGWAFIILLIFNFLANMFLIIY